MTPGIAAMVLSSLLFSAMSALIAAAPGTSAFLTSLARFVVGTTVVGTLGLTGRIKIEFKDTKLLLLRGVLGGFAVYMYFLSIPTLGVARGTAVSYTYPIFATLGGALFLKERIGARVWVALSLTLGGLILLRLGDWVAGGVWEPWFFLALTGAVISGLAVVTVRKLTRTDSSPVIFLSQSLIGLWIVFVPALGTPTVLSVPVALILLGVGLTAAAAQLLMTWSYRTVDVATGSLLSMLTPVLNVVIGLLIFQEILSPLQALGAGLILVSCVLVVLPGRGGAR